MNASRRPSLDTSKQSDGSTTGLVLTGYECPPTEFRQRPATLRELHFRHSSWRVQREKVWASFKRTCRSNARMMRFAECGAGVYVQLRDDNKGVRLSCDRCRDRLCHACGRDRAGLMSEALLQFTNEKKMRFVTLTRRHSHAPLTDQIDNLYRCFSALRKRSWWKRHVVGGGAFLEVKLSESTGCWHVHLHLLVEGEFIPQKELSAEWLAVTSDSSIVDVRAVPNAGDVCKYVTKYVTKPCDASIFHDAAKLDEFVLAIQGRRLCLTWGTWRGHNLAEPPPDDHTWTTVCSLWELKRRVSDGDALAVFVATALASSRPDVVAALDSGPAE